MEEIVGYFCRDLGARSADEGDSQGRSSPWRIEGRKLQTECFNLPGLHSEI